MPMTDTMSAQLPDNQQSKLPLPIVIEINALSLEIDVPNSSGLWHTILIDPPHNPDPPFHDLKSTIS